MKKLLSIFISTALAVSGYAQTRYVLVGTNNAVIQPTNFWSADASNARTGLGLGTAATNPATAFQSSSTVLSNLASSNAVNLTNLRATNIVGVIPSSNIATVNFTNISGTLAIVSGGTGATNASGARTALELGTAATNSSSAFQPSSTVLSNLTILNAVGLTNIAASSIVGTVALASNITGTAPLASNVTGIVSLANGGTAGTNALSARTSLGATTIGANLFTLVNPDDTRFIRLNANNTVSALSATDMRTALSVGTNAGTVTSVGMTVPNIFSLSTSTITSSGTFGLTLANQSSRQALLVPNGGGIPVFRGIESDDLPSLAISKITGLQTAIDGKLATNGTAPLAVNVTGTVAVANGGTGGTTAETARTGLGASTIGSGLFTLFNPSAVRFIRLNADNTVSSLSDSDFRTAIGLASAATNPATAFQSSSANLTNLAANNGSSLTNIPLAGVNGALATNGNAINLTNFPSLLLRTNGNGEWLTNITAANITGTVAQASNVTGTIAISNGGSGATTAGGARTNLGLGWSALANSNAATSLLGFTTNSQVVANIAEFPLTFTNSAVAFQTLAPNNIQFPSTAEAIIYYDGNDYLQFRSGDILASKTIAFTNSAAAATRTNLGLGWPALTNTNAATSLLGFTTNGLVVANTGTNMLTFTNPIKISDGSGVDNLTITDGRKISYMADQSYINLEEMTFYPSISIFNGTNTLQISATASTTRTNLGLGWSALTNSNAATSLLGFTTNGQVVANTGTNVLTFGNLVVDGNGFANGEISRGPVTIDLEDQRFVGAWEFETAIGFETTNVAATTRTNLGLGWSALTNTNAGTGLVSVNTNGVVVSPTNFWQVAPIQTLVQDFTLIGGTQTNSATNARNLYIYSLNTNLINVSNIIVLPTNSATFNGDEATVIHKGTTNTTTVVRQAGSTNNLITLSRFDESVKFIRELGQWDFYHNISFVEAIQFSGTNASANAAATRTNLGLGATNDVEFNSVRASANTSGAGVYALMFNAGNTGFRNVVNPRTNDYGFYRLGNAVWLTDSNSFLEVVQGINFSTPSASSATRTNLGIPLAALTNTNNAKFQEAIFTTNAAPTNAGNFGNHAAWMGVNIVTNGVTNTFLIPLYK